MANLKKNENKNETKTKTNPPLLKMYFDIVNEQGKVVFSCDRPWVLWPESEKEKYPSEKNPMLIKTVQANGGLLSGNMRFRLVTPDYKKPEQTPEDLLLALGLGAATPAPEEPEIVPAAETAEETDPVLESLLAQEEQAA